MINECQEHEHVWGDPLLRNPYLVAEKMRFVLVPCRKCVRYFPLFYVKRLIQERKAIKEVMGKLSVTEKQQLESSRMGWKVKRFDLWRKHTPDEWSEKSKNK